MSLTDNIKPLRNIDVMVRGCTILLICCFGLLCAGLLTAWSNPCIGYEPNIYVETPVIFWIGIFSCYLVGIAIILISQYYIQLPKYITRTSYIAMGIAALSLMSTHIIRGYKLINITGDTGTHLGILKTLIQTGMISDAVAYPSVHVEPAMFNIVTGVDPSTVLSIFPIITYCLFTLGVCLIARRVLPLRGEVCFATIVALLLPIGSMPLIRTVPTLYLAMNIADFALLPLFIYVVMSWMLGHDKMIYPLFILSISTIFYHPNVSVVCIVIYLALTVFIISPFFGRNVIPSKMIPKILVIMVSMITTFFIWLWAFFGSRIIQGITLIFSDAELTERGVGTSINIMNTASDLGYGIETVLKIGGINIFIYGMIIVAGIIFIKYYWNDSKYTLVKALFVIAGAMSIVIVFALVGDFIGKPDRFIKSVYIVALLSTGFVLYHLLSRITHNFNKVTLSKIGAVFAIIAILCFASVITCHASPYTNSPGHQTTKASFIGIENMLPTIDYNKNVNGIHITGLQRFVTAIYGSVSAVGSNAYGDKEIMVSTNRGSIDHQEAIPYHFGYDKGALSIVDSVDIGYLIMIEKDKKFYPAYYPELIQYRWSEQDFRQLTMDEGLSRVYNNGGMEMYRVI